MEILPYPNQLKVDDQYVSWEEIFLVVCQKTVYGTFLTIQPKIGERIHVNNRMSGWGNMIRSMDAYLPLPGKSWEDVIMKVKVNDIQVVYQGNHFK